LFYQCIGISVTAYGVTQDGVNAAVVAVLGTDSTSPTLPALAVIAVVGCVVDDNDNDKGDSGSGDAPINTAAPETLLESISINNGAVDDFVSCIYCHDCWHSVVL
jgi:hypothetical protein